MLQKIESKKWETKASPMSYNSIHKPTEVEFASFDLFLLIPTLLDKTGQKQRFGLEGPNKQNSKASFDRTKLVPFRKLHTKCNNYLPGLAC